MAGGNPPRGVGSGKEPRIVIRSAAHVKERPPCARVLPVAHVDAGDVLEPVRCLQPFGPADLDLTREGEHGLRVMRKTTMTLARVAFRIADREPRCPAEGVGR